MQKWNYEGFLPTLKTRIFWNISYTMLFSVNKSSEKAK